MKTKRRSILLLCLLSILTVGQVRAAESSPSTQGAALYQTGKYQQALPLFKQAVKEKPQDANALFYYGLTLHRLGQVAAARQVYNKVIGFFPGSPAARQAMGIILQPGQTRATGGQSVRTPASTGLVTRPPQTVPAPLPIFRLYRRKQECTSRKRETH